MIKNTIKNVSNIRRLPRLGKIRLGIKAGNGDKSYPKETDYFVCPVEVQKVYGDKPKELDIIFPVDDVSIVFPQSYKWYSFTTLKCKGDGETAMRRVQDLTPEQKEILNGDIPENSFDMVEVNCPCPLLEEGKCSQVGSLSFMIPKVSLAGVYQIDTRSINSFVNINSALELAKGIAGRIAMIPFKLKRIPQKIEYEGKMQTHYILSLEHQLDMDAIRKMTGENHLLSGPISITSKEPKGPVVPAAFKEPPGSKGVVEDVDTPPQEHIKEMDVTVISVSPRDESKKASETNHLIVTCKEHDDSTAIEFITTDVEQGRYAWKLCKEGKRANVQYSVTPKGEFLLKKIEADIPF
jgi:hypothetical protein